MFSALSVVTPVAQEPVSVALAKQHTRIDNDADDTLVGAYITAARTWVEQILGRCVAPQQLRWILAREQPRNGYPYLSMPLTLLILPQWLTYPFWHHRGGIELPRQPVNSVDQVAYGQFGLPDTVLTAGTDYDVDTASARLRVHIGSEVVPNDHMAITFTAGYGATGGEALPQPIIHAILLLTAFLYEQRGDSGGEAPAAVDMLLAPYRLITFG